jgi:hypothetical protein
LRSTNVVLPSHEERDLRECYLFSTGLDLSRLFSFLLCLLIAKAIRLARGTRWTLWSASRRTCGRNLRPIHVSHFETSRLKGLKAKCGEKIWEKDFYVLKHVMIRLGKRQPSRGQWSSSGSPSSPSFLPSVTRAVKGTNRGTRRCQMFLGCDGEAATLLRMPDHFGHASHQTRLAYQASGKKARLTPIAKCTMKRLPSQPDAGYLS